MMPVRFLMMFLGDGVLLVFCRLAQALVLDPKYVKAIYRYEEFSIRLSACDHPVCCRRAVCHLQNLRYQRAVADFKRLLTLEPKNDTVRGQMMTTQKLIKKIEFEKASSHKSWKTDVFIGLFRPLNGKGRRTQWIDAER